MADFFLLALPILTAAFGGMICERAGVMNIALEGLMIIGAATAAAAHVLLETRTGFSIPLALIFSVLAGGLFSLIHAFASIAMKADQFISGMGINFLCGGLSVFICQILFRMDRSMSYTAGFKPLFFGIHPGVLITAAALAFCWFMLYKCPCRNRYIAVLISGFLSGLAGACIVLSFGAQFTVNTINGKGFIALAVVYIGRRFIFAGVQNKRSLDGANDCR